VFLSARKDLYNECVFKRFGHAFAGPLSWNAGFTVYDPASAPLKLVHKDGKVGVGRGRCCGREVRGRRLGWGVSSWVVRA
jgi:hypothetical protein